MIVSLGEALMDLIHGPGGAAPEARVGGSPYNVAIALSRLGVDAGFVCPFSTDDYGQRLARVLEEEGVRRCVEEWVEAPTATAEVFTDPSGHPSYVFRREGTADRALWERPPIDALPESLEVLHFGSLVLAQEGDWPAWREAIAAARSRGVFIAFDPNLRVALIDDMERYRSRLDEAVGLADLIKASDEDLALLYPGCEPAERIQGWRASHRSVVLTEGAKGTQLWDRGGTHVIHRETVAGPIVDTVGAGDTFQAALLAWFSRRGALGRPLATDEARDLLAFATRAAGLCCRQSGCQPPTLAAVLEGS